MKLELPDPALREVIDIRTPVTAYPESAYPGFDWKEQTALLAQDCLVTSAALVKALDEPLPEGYKVDLVPHELDSPLAFLVVESVEDIENPNFDPVSRLWVRLIAHDGTDTIKPVVIFDNDQTHIRLHAWGPAQTARIRGVDFTVRHQQTWKLWNYNQAKRDQGYTEEEFPGDLWQPDYTEQLIVVGGEYNDMDLVGVLHGLEEAVSALQSVTTDEIAAQPSWQQREEDRIRWVANLNKIRAEVAEATGITLHTTTGMHVLREAHGLLSAVRNFVTSASESK